MRVDGKGLRVEIVGGPLDGIEIPCDADSVYVLVWSWIDEGKQMHASVTVPMREPRKMLELCAEAIARSGRPAYVHFGVRIGETLKALPLRERDRALWDKMLPDPKR